MISQAIERIRSNAFARNSLILFVGSMVGNVLNYLFHLVMGRMVSIQTYGEVESLISLITIVSVPATALTMVATKYSASYKADQDKIGNYAFFKYLNKKTFVLTVPLFITTICLTPLLKEFLNIQDDAAIVLVWMIMALTFISSVSGGILYGWQKFKEFSWASIWGLLVKFLGAIVFIRFGLAVGGVIGGIFLGVVVSYALNLFYLRTIFKKDGHLSNAVGREINFSTMKRYVIPVLWGNVAISILGNADMVLAKHGLDPQAAGQYGALTIVSKIIFFVTSIIATVLFSMSAENSHKNDSSLSILKNAILAISIISIGSIIVYFTFPKFVLSMLFGNKYNDVAYLLGWFSILAALYSFSNLFFQYFLSIHRTKIAYVFLGIALLEVLTLLLVGKSISAILISVIITQILAVAAGLVFLFKPSKSAA